MQSTAPALAFNANTEIARNTAKILLDIGAVNLHPDDPFTLTSGKKSPVYVDCRRIISFPEERTKLLEYTTEFLNESYGLDKINAVAGGETAGIPFAAMLGQHWKIPMAYIRKKPKGFGKNNRIEGVLAPESNTLLVEDMATDGGSKIAFVQALRQAGYKCDATFVFFYYGIFPNTLTLFHQHDLKLYSLATWWDIIDYAGDKGLLSAKKIDKIREFLVEPDKWKP